MAFRYTVQSGDCLWSLARRYLGRGTRFPDIVAEHNKAAARVARFGYPDRLLPIEDPNLIFVGQTLIVPIAQKIPQPGTGKRHEAETKATGLGLKMEYNFEDGKNPIKYKPMVTRDYTITSEMIGKITIENLSCNGLQHNFEIAMAVDKNALSGKLEFGDKALAELTKSVETQFDMATGKMSLKASIAAHADIGPYAFDAEADAPNHFKAIYKPQPISAVVEEGKRRYKYSAEIAFKVEVTLHPSQKNGPEPVKVTAPMQEPAVKIQDAGNPANDSVTPLTVIGIIAAYILILIYGPKGPIMRNGGMIPKYSPASDIPFMHQIDPNDPRLQS